MGNEYLQYPATVKALAEELKTACNDYNARRIDNTRIKEIVMWYATAQADKLFAANQINPTISKIIGKKRVKLISDLLDGYQQRIGGSVK